MLPGSLGPNLTPASPPPGRPGGGCQTCWPPLFLRPVGWGWEDPCSLSSPGTKTRVAQEARCHRTPYGKAVRGRGREGKIDPELSATEPGAEPQPPEHRPRALPARGWCGCSRVAWIDRPKTTCSPAAPPPRAQPPRSRALGPGRSRFRPAPVTQHPTSLRRRISRPCSCVPGAGSQPGAGSREPGARSP